MGEGRPEAANCFRMFPDVAFYFRRV